MSRNKVEDCLEEVESKDGILIVSISDGKAYEDIFNAVDIGAKVSEINGVTLKMSVECRDYGNFKEIYKVGNPPLICIIGSNGIVLDVVRGEISQEHFLKVLNFSFENQKRGCTDQMYYPFQELSRLSVQEKVIEEERSSEVQKIYSTVPKTDRNDTVLISPIDNNKPINKQTNSPCRLKFTLPDGSHLSDTFEPTTTLEGLKQFLRERIPGVNGFMIVRPHPKEEFQSSQDKVSLRQLGIQSGTGLFVRFNTSKVTSAVSIWAFFTAVYSMLISVYTYFFPTRNNASQNPNQNRPQTNKSPFSSPERDRMINTNAKTNTSTRGVNRRQNMYRLSDLDSKDDDNSTYNGNSTQQQ